MLNTATDFSSQSLAGAELGRTFVVERVCAPVSQPDWGLRLEEIGFIPGERVSVLTRGVPGGDPLVVRVGLSTFALRRAEADCVCVVPVS
ncbi:MAG: ferrous iron transport protein A [Burkholderiaceae bacterium]|jgi:ferrous iron transport protein A